MQAVHMQVVKAGDLLLRYHREAAAMVAAGTIGRTEQQHSSSRGINANTKHVKNKCNKDNTGSKSCAIQAEDSG